MTAIIVGDSADSHVRAVLDAIRSIGSTTTLLLDGPTLQSKGFTVELASIYHDGLRVDLRAGTVRGWLRRYAPTAWGTGLMAGSHEALKLKTFVGLVGSITRLAGPRWLTSVDSMLRAEDRLFQLQTAADLGIRVPVTMVTSDATAVIDRLGESFVVKPLGSGYFWRDGTPHAVFCSRLTASDLQEVDLGAVPFVAQEEIHAGQHLRVVTVGGTAWIARLNALDFPLDWRQDEAAHLSWNSHTDGDVERMAVELAGRLNVGYSSQDWLEDGDGAVFVDLNPGGQWLFLPDEVARPVTVAIALFLAGESS
jgi:hypothetical protein